MAVSTGVALITPSSVSTTSGTVSITGTGTITFTDAEDISVDDCFSSTYDSYYLVMNHTGSSNAPIVHWFMRASGSNATGADYNYQDFSVSGSDEVGVRVTATSNGGKFGFSVTGVSGTFGVIHNPALAQQTVMRSYFNTAYLNSYLQYSVSLHELTTAYDGITLNRVSGTMTGELRIYGLYK